MYAAEPEPHCRCHTCASIHGAPLGGVRLPFERESVGAARRFVAYVATAWRVPQIVETAELLTSEVFTNALLHGGPLTGYTLRLLTIRDRGLFRVEVHDAGGARPHLCHPGDTDETGRGWFLVEQLADDHGSYPTNCGKAVWFGCAAWPVPDATA